MATRAVIIEAQKAMRRVLPQAQGALVINDLRLSIASCEAWLERHEECPSCRGTGFSDPPERCPDCKGSGSHD